VRALQDIGGTLVYEQQGQLPTLVGYFLERGERRLRGGLGPHSKVIAEPPR